MPLSRPRLLNKILLAIAGVSFIGFFDSAYLLADHYFALPLPCSITHGCETVLTSPYSMVGPIPLAAFGVAYYLIVFFFTLYLFTSDQITRRMLQYLFALAAIGTVLSIIFELMQVFLIHAICQYCALSALCTFILFGFGDWALRTQRKAIQ
jgi:uncharacterized membrane protein